MKDSGHENYVSPPTPADSDSSSLQCAYDLEPIAIIGLSCRFPDGASNPQKLWTKLASGSSAWSKGPGNRYNFGTFIEPKNSHPTTTNTSGGHFLSEDIAAFDASFFGIHPVEARAMDPQQRLLLEVAYEAFENAGLTSAQVWASNSGVYVGQWTSDYAEVLARDMEYSATYHTTGVGPAITSNRISYHFNLLGPSLTVDTGCSASLVALHMAVQSLRSKETDMSFVGGVNLLVDPQRFTYQSKLKMFSNDGRSFSFDHRANGYGRGEGCSGVVLKPLAAALRDGNQIRGVIRNSVINQDGRTPGITVPNGAAQERAIRKAYADAGLDLRADYVEAHGTGTAMGDPIEVEAIASALTKGNNMTERLPIGSIKGNIGHTESSAGLAGLIKAVLMLEKGHIPPQVNFEMVNSKILLDDWNLRVPLKLEPRNLRRISVNSFGYGGTNAHIIVDSAKEYVKSAERLPPSAVGKRPRVFILSAASEKSCQVFATNIADYVSQTADSTTESGWLDQLAYTLNRRSIYNHRVSIVAEDVETLVSKLQELSQEPIPASSGFKETRVGFVFSGQGAQYYNMGRELINVWPQFTASLVRANKQLSSLGCEWDVFQELQRDAQESRIDEPGFGQPLSTAIQMAFIDTLAALDLVPAAVAGHSSGEIAAAYCAGFLSFEDAIKVSYHRGRLTSELLKREPDMQGAMLAVGASARIVEEYIAGLESDVEKVQIACYNSPSSVTVSGDRVVIENLSKILENNSVFNRVLRTKGVAYHSEQMRKIESEYTAALEGVQVQNGLPSVRMFSSLTGSEVKQKDFDKDYWVQNLISPVFFEDALWNLCQSENGASHIDMIVELGPHSQLEGPIKQTIQTLQRDASGIRYISTLKRKSNAAESLLKCLGHLFVEGVSVNFHYANNGFNQRLPALLPDLPPYAFDHEKTFWHEGRLSKEYRHRQFPPHELLGNASADYNRIEPRWRRFLNLKDLPWLQNHIVQGQIVFPAAGYIAMAVEAIRRHKKMSDPTVQIKGYNFRNVSIGKALVITQDMADHEICFSLRPEARTARNSSSSWMEFRAFTVASDLNWTEHCRGLVTVMTGTQTNTINDSEYEASYKADFQDEIQQAVQESQHHINPRKFYYLSRDVGLQWNMPFDNVTDMMLGSDTAVCTVSVPDLGQCSSDNSDPIYLIHPATLDASLFHGLCSILLLKQGVKSPPVPTFIQNLFISADHHDRPGSQLTCYSTRTDGPLTFDVTVCAGPAGKEQVVLRADGVTATKLPGDIYLNSTSHEICHTTRWVTYCESLTVERMDALCSATRIQASVAEQNRQLNALALSYIQRALSEVALEDVAEDYHRYWYDWMRLCAKDPHELSFLPANGFHTHLGAVAEGLSKIGLNLSGILRGSVEPLALLNDGDLLSRLYSDERCQRCYREMSAYCLELARQKPGMKLIEVGAGTGSATEAILHALCPDEKCLISRYDFTDVSPVFFEAAKVRLSKYSDVTNYQILDIEQDVSQQGLEVESYDLVIACNVVHATTSIGDSLNHIRSLLRPGGVLLLMEITKDEIFYNLIFGSLPGWSAGHTGGRKFSPLLSASEWTDMLPSHGFSRPAICLNDYEEANGGTLSVFISGALDTAATSLILPVDVVGDQTKTTELLEFANYLKSELPIQNVSHSELQATSRPGVISIFPPSFCDTFADSSSPEAWQSFKDRLLSSKAILLITKRGSIDCTNPVGAMWTGFARCFRIEHPDIRLVTLDVHLDTSVHDCARFVVTLLKSPSFDMGKIAAEVENEFSERQGQLYVPRIFHERKIDRYIRDSIGVSEPEIASFLNNDRVLTASFGVPGLLDTLHWKDDETVPTLGPDDVQLELRAASINFKDVLIAAGQLEGITEMRNDCSGVVTDIGANMTKRFKIGDRVCCYYSRSYTNRPRVHGDCCAVIPDQLSFEEAASLPIVWATVYYSLVDKGHLAKGESVLIHSAAGAVGQAAILLAQHIGAEVYVTVSSEEKKKFLLETYGITPDHIFSSRTTDFGKKIRKMRPIGGVDVILNSLSGDMFRESCNTIAPYGRFVEIGRKDFMENMLMPTKFLLKNITFAYVDLALLIEDNKPLVRRLLRDVINLMASGAVRPTSITTMPISDMEIAFRQIEAGKHIGKVILTVNDGQLAKIVPQPPRPAQLKPDGVYIIAGGLGGLGKAIIRWMGDHGARHIITLSRSGTCDETAVALIDEMRSKGTSVIVKRCDIASIDEVKALMAEIEQDGVLSPVRGVIQSAMVVKDSTFVNMTYENWSAALQPKIAGSWNLHTVLPKTIDFFVMISSAVAISGNPGQSNYASGCAYQDALARARSVQGLPAYSINSVAVLDTGFVSENPEVADALRRQGLGTITTTELLGHLSYAVMNPIASEPSDSQCSIGLVPTGNERGLRPSTWMADSKFRHLTRRNVLAADPSNTSENVIESINAAETEEEVLEWIFQAILKQLSKLIATPIEQLSGSRSLDDYGVDSLVAVELRNWVGAYLQANIPILVVRGTKSIRELAGLVAKESKLVSIMR